MRIGALGLVERVGDAGVGEREQQVVLDVLLEQHPHEAEDQQREDEQEHEQLVDRGLEAAGREQRHQQRDEEDAPEVDEQHARACRRTGSRARRAASGGRTRSRSRSSARRCGCRAAGARRRGRRPRTSRRRTRTRPRAPGPARRGRAAPGAATSSSATRAAIHSAAQKATCRSRALKRRSSVTSSATVSHGARISTRCRPYPGPQCCASPRRTPSASSTAPTVPLTSARVAAPPQRAAEPRGEVRVAGQPGEHERGHRRHHRHREQRAALGREELRDERGPEQPGLDVEEVAEQAAAERDGAGERVLLGAAGRQRVAARGREQRLHAEHREVRRARELERRERGGRGGEQRGDAERGGRAPHEVAGGRARRRPRSRRAGRRRATCAGRRRCRAPGRPSRRRPRRGS